MVNKFEVRESSARSELFYHLYQPIYNLTSRDLYGHEALLRCPPYSPESFFANARERQMLYKLDMYSIQKAIHSFFEVSKNGLLFVNVYPYTLMQSFFLNDLEAILLASACRPRQIVFEINESEDSSHLYMNHVIHEMRAFGLKIAMDDVGKGESFLSGAATIEPDIIKLDKWFLEDLNISKGKQNLIGRMLHFCGSDVRLILEGIEQQEELEAACLLGLTFGQGFLLGEPKPLEYINK